LVAAELTAHRRQAEVLLTYAIDQGAIERIAAVDAGVSQRHHGGLEHVGANAARLRYPAAGVQVNVSGFTRKTQHPARAVIQLHHAVTALALGPGTKGVALQPVVAVQLFDDKARD